MDAIDYFIKKYVNMMYQCDVALMRVECNRYTYKDIGVLCSIAASPSVRYITS